VATKFALLLRRRGPVVFAIALCASVVGSAHGIHPGGLGFWDGPL
jgi:hypothetical protein